MVRRSPVERGGEEGRKCKTRCGNAARGVGLAKLAVGRGDVKLRESSGGAARKEGKEVCRLRNWP